MAHILGCVLCNAVLTAGSDSRETAVKTIKRALTNSMFGQERSVAGPDGLLANLIPFDSGSKYGGYPTMRARRFDGQLTMGQRGYNTGVLHPAEAAAFRAANAIYVVWSYWTPIAWVDASGKQYYAQTSYGVTTARHKRMSASWMASKGCDKHMDDGALCAAFAAMCGHWTGDDE